MKKGPVPHFPQNGGLIFVHYDEKKVLDIWGKVW
nr:MAG TPA: hypothetical protein [Caudoviricetes sp.]